MCKIKHNPRQNQEKFQGIHKRIPFSLYFLVLFGLLPFYPFTFKSLPCLLLVQFYQAVEFKVGFDFIQYPLYDDIHHASFAVVGRAHEVYPSLLDKLAGCFLFILVIIYRLS